MSEPNAARQAPVPTLSVDAAETGLRFRLDRPSEARDEPLQEEYLQRVDAATLAALLTSADELLRGAPRPGLAAEARRRGGVLYRTLIPEVLATQLRAIEGPLAVRTSVFGVPWELLHDGQEFWGVRYALGRRLVIDRPVTPVRHVRLGDRARALVLGADPRHDLPSVGREIEAVAVALAARADVVCVGTQLAGLDAVIDYFGQGFDLIHFAGHIVDDAGEVGLLVGDGRVLRASAIPPALTGRPLVMLNGCGSARSAAPGRRGNWEESLSGVAHGFLFGGAIAVVGTLAEVRDRPATTLALAFYRHLLSRERVGEALRRARDECRRDPTTADTADWLSFVLYGSPALSLTEDEAPGSQPPTGRLRRRFGRRAPREGGGWPTRRSILIGGGALVTGGIGLALLEQLSFRASPQAAAIGVMTTQVSAGDVPDSLRKHFRTSLSTMLHDVGEMATYDQERIDFECTERKQCGFAGARALGMAHMVTPWLSAAGDRMALEVVVVDVTRNGLLEFRERVHGPTDKFNDLQSQLIERLLQRLGVSLTDEKRAHIFQERTNDSLDSYEMLMKTMGGGKASPSPAPPPSPPPTSRFSLVREAWADDAASDDDAIRAVLQAYAAALTARKVDDLEKLQVRMTPEQRAAIVTYLGNAIDLHVEFSGVEVLVSGTEAVASYVREDSFTDARLGRPMHLKVRLSTRLAKTPEGWRLKLGE